MNHAARILARHQPGSRSLRLGEPNWRRVSAADAARKPVMTSDGGFCVAKQRHEGRAGFQA